MMWWLRGFEQDGDELLVEFPLPGVDTSSLKALLGLQPDDLLIDCFPINRDIAHQVSRLAKGAPPLGVAEYFVEFDA
jgi:hypothetical protein